MCLDEPQENTGMRNNEVGVDVFPMVFLVKSKAKESFLCFSNEQIL
jgi:hypothetical protein